MDFDSFTLVFLVDGPSPEPADPDTLQDEHLGYLASLQEAGHLLGAGPSRWDVRGDLRGLSLFRASADEARRLAEADPAVRAGRFRRECLTWTVPADAMVPGPGRFPRSVAEVLGRRP